MATQVNLLELQNQPQQDCCTPASTTIAIAKATRLRQLAKKMQAAIDNKKNPAVGEQRPTARRARMVEQMYQEALRLETIQAWLYAIADATEAKTLPDVLAKINQKAQLELFLALNKRSSEELQRMFVTEAYAEWKQKLQRIGICSLQQLQSAITAVNNPRLTVQRYKWGM